jgi:CarboxypepD_reg-like domain/TonB-dependent Receptor Plug Domain
VKKRKSEAFAFIFLLLICCFSSNTLLAQNSTTGEVRGLVYDKESGEPIIFTNVIIRELKIAKQTDNNGFYSITKLKPGTYTVLCFAFGYDSISAFVKITEGDITTQNLYVKKKMHELAEVNVSAEKQKSQTETKVSNITITQKELKALPSFGGEPDLAQYLQVLPGVVFSGDQGGQLYMRGGPPVENKIMLDGMTIYNPFHSIGLFSVFDADIIRSADVYAGGFNAQYGGRVGSIIDVSTREGNKTEFAGKLNINPMTTKILVEGPFSKFQNGSSASYIFSYKTSYLDQTSKYLYPYAGSNGLPYTFNDFYGKISFVGENGSKVNFFGFNFSDNVSYPSTHFNWNSYGAGANFFLITGGSTVINGTVAYSDYLMNEDIIGEAMPKTRMSEIKGFSIGLNFTSFLGKDDIKYGFEMNGFNTNFNFVNAYGLGLAELESNTELCAFVKYKKTVGRFLFEPGLRIQEYASLGEMSLEPRFSSKYNMTDKVRLKCAIGYYTQNIMSATSDQDVVNLFYGFLSGPESDISNSKLNISGDSKLTKAIHYVGGVEADIGQHGSINIEAFYKDFIQLPEINRNKQTATDQDFIIENGKAYGGDFLYKYDFRHFYFWAVYSLTYVTRSDGNITYVPSFDRRHNINLVGTYTFGKNESFSFNARWNFGTGFPFTQTQGFYSQVDYSQGASSNIYSQNGTLGVQYGTLNDGRLPYFHRLDLSLSKKIKLQGKKSLMIVAACTNVYNRSNIFYFDRINYKRIDQLPIMPTLGINFNF